MKMHPYIVYAKIDSNNYIHALNSSVFLADTAGWVEIDRGFGNKYGHAQTGYLPKSIRTRDGAYRYKLADGKPVECSAGEVAEQIQNVSAPGTKTLENRIDALEKGMSEIKTLLVKLLEKSVQ